MPWDNLWSGVLGWLAQVITPDWNDVIGWLPSLLTALLVLILLMLLGRWALNARLNRSRVPHRLRVAAPPPGVHMPGPSRWPFILPIGAFLIGLSLAVHPGRIAAPTVDAQGSVTAGAGAAASELVNLPLLAIGLAILLVGIVGWYRDARHEWMRLEHPEAVPAAASTALLAARTPPPGAHLPGPSPWPFFVPIALAVLFFGLVFSPALVIGGALMAAIAAAGWYRDAGHEYRQVDAGHPPEPRTRDPERAFPTALVGVYATIAVIAVLLAFAPHIIALVNAKPSAAAVASPAGGGAPVSSVIKLTAKDVKFDLSTFSVPAGKAFTIQFTNDDAVPHNVAIFQGSSASGTNVFRGKVFAGPGVTMTYEVPALPAGSYYFHCDVHPTAMFGTITSK